VRRAITGTCGPTWLLHGDLIDRVRACASVSRCIIQYDELNVALRPPGRYTAVSAAAAAADTAATAARNGRGKKGGY